MNHQIIFLQKLKLFLYSEFYFENINITMELTDTYYIIYFLVHKGAHDCAKKISLTKNALVWFCDHFDSFLTELKKRIGDIKKDSMESLQSVKKDYMYILEVAHD